MRNPRVQMASGIQIARTPVTTTDQCREDQEQIGTLTQCQRDTVPLFALELGTGNQHGSAGDGGDEDHEYQRKTHVVANFGDDHKTSADNKPSLQGAPEGGWGQYRAGVGSPSHRPLLAPRQSSG